MNPTVHSFSPRAMSHESAEHLGLIATRLGRGEFTLGGAVWRYTLAPETDVGWPSDPFVIVMEWSGAPFRLVASPALLSLLQAHLFPLPELALLPEELALAGFELAWAEIAARLEQLSGRRVRLVSAGRATGGVAPGELVFRVGLDSASAADGVHALLITDAPGLALLAILARRQPVAPPAPRDPALPVPLRLEVGEARLPLAALRALSAHDVVLLDGAGLDPASPVLWLRVGGRHVLRARLQGEALTIESVLENAPMSLAPPPADAADALASLDELEIRLSFDLGDKLLTLGELSALQPGQVFALDAPLPRAVAIRANGRLIGRGELVRVDEALGVRVLELAARETQA